MVKRFLKLFQNVHVMLIGYYVVVEMDQLYPISARRLGIVFYNIYR